MESLHDLMELRTVERSPLCEEECVASSQRPDDHHTLNTDPSLLSFLTMDLVSNKGRSYGQTITDHLNLVKTMMSLVSSFR